MNSGRSNSNFIQLNELGFTLLSSTITLFIAGISMVALQSVLTLSLRGSSHADLRMHKNSLADTVKQRVNCTQTFDMTPAFNPKTDCSSSSPRPILLKDSEGNAITSALSKGNFDPRDLNSDKTIDGSGMLGDWYLRAYCEPTNSNLVIRYAKVSNRNPIEFLKDPLTKRPYDWSDSPSNPLFGSNDRVICSGSEENENNGNNNENTAGAPGFYTDYCYAQAAARSSVPSCENGYYLKATIKETDNDWDGYSGVCCYTKPGPDPRMTFAMRNLLSSPNRSANANSISRLLKFTIGKTYNQIALLCSLQPADFSGSKKPHSISCPLLDILQ